MGIIGVDCAGLASLAAGCEQHAADVTGGRSAAAVSGGLSATSAAVRAMHIDVDAAAQRIAARLQSTGREVSVAATSFAVTEVDNGYVIDEAGQPATMEV